MPDKGPGSKGGKKKPKGGKGGKGGATKPPSSIPASADRAASRAERQGSR